MKEVVVWLTGLSKLVPLHSWNGFNNPCIMVETMGQPVESRNAHFRSKLEGVGEENLEALDAKLTRQALRNSRRVYSDLGFSSNLMELMAGTDGESEFRGNADGDEPNLKSGNRVSRFGSERYVGRRSAQSTPGRGKEVPDLIRNPSFGKRSFICSRRDDAMPHVSGSSHPAGGILLAA
ncbi:uncharacterized protein LOC110772330 [Prunus avium]|nr:uncharacterized protein LOC110772330 [Prunus avium]